MWINFPGSREILDSPLDLLCHYLGRERGVTLLQPPGDRGLCSQPGPTDALGEAGWMLGASLPPGEEEIPISTVGVGAKGRLPKMHLFDILIILNRSYLRKSQCKDTWTFLCFPESRR